MRDILQYILMRKRKPCFLQKTKMNLKKKGDANLKQIHKFLFM